MKGVGVLKKSKESTSQISSSEIEKIDQSMVVSSFDPAPSSVEARMTIPSTHFSPNEDKQSSLGAQEAAKVNTTDNNSTSTSFSKNALETSLSPYTVPLDNSIDTTKTLVLEEESLPPKDLSKFSFPTSNINKVAEDNTSFHKRVRETFEKLGYKIKVLAYDQLILKADLGRYNYDVLIYLLPTKQSLDWADLLNSRRELGVKYLAIFGEHRDLLKPHSSIDLARATLWSWQGIEHLKDITKKVPISPVDLEPFFKSEGLFEDGIENFEQMIYARIAEQGVFSNILSILASFKPPCVFFA